ncbi:MAG TPA: aminotransferase class IV [Acidimicrobiales bacterium]|nr:aminotransferase class IV [Acidimicrobiales bacterium]
MSSVWLNGVLLDPSVATLSVFDHGTTVGDGVFETMLCYPDTGLAFAAEHLRRLRSSAAGLYLAVPYDDDALLRAVRDVIESEPSGAGCVRVRVTVTGGAGPLGSDRGSAEPTVIIAAAPQKPWPATSTLAPVPWPRNERGALAGLKTTSYAENVVALQAAHAAGADEALFCDTQGNVSEGTGTNVFAVIDDRLVTPPLTTGCLAGVTRHVVIDSYGAAERAFGLDDLARASEVFITSTTREVQAVCEVVDIATWPNSPGPVTEAAHTAYTTARQSAAAP